jgi:hypothetical protein
VVNSTTSFSTSFSSFSLSSNTGSATEAVRSNLSAGAGRLCVCDIQISRGYVCLHVIVWGVRVSFPQRLFRMQIDALAVAPVCILQHFCTHARRTLTYRHVGAINVHVMTMWTAYA